jgi:tetratricopeptide (TPR) repeat protein
VAYYFREGEEEITMPLFGKKSKEKNGSQNSKEARAVELMTQLFPTCPICGENASYQSQFKLLKNTVSCQSCLAKWRSVSFYGDIEEPEILILDKPDKDKKAKAMKNKGYSIYFWQHFNVDEYNKSLERQVNKLVFNISYAIEKDKEYEEYLNTLRGLGANGVLLIGEIANGTLDISGRKSKERNLLTMGVLGDEHGKHALIRALQDESEEIRLAAVYSLIEYHKSTGDNEIVPELLRVLKEDRSALVRSKTAALLSKIKGNARIMHALVDAKQDKDRPYGELEAAGSWVDLISKAVRFEIPPSVSDQARWALDQLGVPFGIQIGISRLNDERYDWALRSFQREINRADLPNIYKQFNTPYLESKKCQKAIEVQKAKVEETPDDYQVWENLGVAYWISNQLDQAVECYKKALKIDPSNAELHQYLGILNISKDEFKKGIGILEKAVELDPKIAAAHGHLAYAYTKTGQYEKAEDSLEHAKKPGFLTNYKYIRELLESRSSE